MTTARLADVAEINPRGEKVNADDLVSFVGMAELDAMRAEAVPASSRAFAEVAKGYTVFRNGDVLAAKITPCWENGKVGIAHLDHAIGVGSTEFHVLRPRVELHDRYLLHFLRQPHLRAAGELRMTGSGGQKRIPVSFLQKLEIPLPPLPEQRRIAAILDHADALRAKRRQVLTHLDSLTQAIFNDMFGDVVATIPLSEVVVEFRYGTSNKSGATGWPTLRIPNVIDGMIDTTEIKTVDVGEKELERLTLLDGDLLFVRTNGNPDNVGRCAVFTEDAVSRANFETPWIYASYLIRARIRADTEPTFLATFLTTPQGRKLLRDRSKTSAGQYNINIDGIGSVPVPKVDLSKQMEFAAQRDNVAARRAPLLKAQRHDDELVSSLQSRAFRGEL